ncbi:hypothetical protein T11_3585, partial [Trichinella zimbabwensis]
LLPGNAISASPLLLQKSRVLFVLNHCSEQCPEKSTSRCRCRRRRFVSKVYFCLPASLTVDFLLVVHFSTFPSEKLCVFPFLISTQIIFHIIFKNSPSLQAQNVLKFVANFVPFIFCFTCLLSIAQTFNNGTVLLDNKPALHNFGRHPLSPRKTMSGSRIERSFA